MSRTWITHSYGTRRFHMGADLHDSFMWDMTYSYGTWLTHMERDMTHSHGTRRIHMGADLLDSFMWDMTYSYETWLTHMGRDMAHSYGVRRCWFHSRTTRHVTHVNESCHYMNKSCDTYEFIRSHIWMRYATHMEESCRSVVCVILHRTYAVIAHISCMCYTKQNCRNMCAIITQNFMCHITQKFYDCIAHAVIAHMLYYTKPMQS